jgi:hypothetical protein
MEDETKFHWAEGMKYVLEGIKALFVLNGAATVSILTFVGNTKSKSEFLIYAMTCFAVGAVTGPIAFWLAYLTQLNYGNSSRNGENWDSAKKFHFGTYGAVGFGLLLFLSGIALASCGLLRQNQ